MPRPPFPRPQHYAVAQEILRHDDAVHWFGEMTAFILWWKVIDFTNGLVGRCPRCYGDNEDSIITEAFNQPTQADCPECFGTTFEGGYKEIVYAPAIWSPRQEASDQIGRTGETVVRSAEVQPVSIVQLRDNDTAVRFNDSRWRLSSPSADELSTGFGFHGLPDEILRSSIMANLQDRTAVDYRVIVDLDRLNTEGPWEPVVELPNYVYPIGPGPTSGDEGWILFRDDTHTEDNPFPILANVWTTVPIDAGTIDDVGAPLGANTWWSPATNRFRPPREGDFFSVQITFEATTPIIGRELEIELTRDGTNVLYRSNTTLTYPDAPEQVSFTANLQVTPELVTEGAFWRVRCNGAATLQHIYTIVRREYRA